MEMRKFRLLDKQNRCRGICYAVNYAGAEYNFSRHRNGQDTDSPIPSGWAIEEIGCIPPISESQPEKPYCILDPIFRLFGYKRVK